MNIKNFSFALNDRGKVALSTRFILFVWRVKDRAECLIREKNVQSAEKYSCLASLAVFAPLAISDNYFGGSTYLSELAKRIPEDTCMWVFLGYFVAQLAGLLYGLEPPYFDKTTAAKLRWIQYRRVMMLIGVFVWFTATALLSLPHITITSFFMAYACIECIKATIQFTYDLKIEEDYRQLKASTAGLSPVIISELVLGLQGGACE